MLMMGKLEISLLQEKIRNLPCLGERDQIPGENKRNRGNHGIIISNTMIASVSFVLTGNLICNFPLIGEISNFSL